MKDVAQTQEKKIGYVVRESRRARRMRIAVYCDGAVVVTRPRGATDNIVEKFVAEKTGWILRKLEYFKQFSGTGIARFGVEDYLMHKGEALVLAEKRVEYFNKVYGFSYNNICIKNQKTRWGSCSRKGNLNFNYKILFIPKVMRDYIIVHELCHLKELNHSRKFWDLVVRAIPNHVEVKRELRNNILNYR
ncbi:MAG: M48 family metallopeptidase [Patescibacteria group bacterium]|nr:MAG: M48 family metallopeptidase [Patescibacteria group bacterium]